MKYLLMALFLLGIGSAYGQTYQYKLSEVCIIVKDGGGIFNCFGWNKSPGTIEVSLDNKTIKINNEEGTQYYSIDKVIKKEQDYLYLQVTTSKADKSKQTGTMRLDIRKPSRETSMSYTDDSICILYKS